MEHERVSQQKFTNTYFKEQDQKSILGHLGRFRRLSWHFETIKRSLRSRIKRQKQSKPSVFERNLCRLKDLQNVFKAYS